MKRGWGYRIARLGFPLALHSHGMEPNFVPTLASLKSVDNSVNKYV